MIVQGQKHCKLQDQDGTFWNAFPQHQLLALEVSEGSSIQVYKHANHHNY